jgi:hypothetical protein
MYISQFKRVVTARNINQSVVHCSCHDDVTEFAQTLTVTEQQLLKDGKLFLVLSIPCTVHIIRHVNKWLICTGLEVSKELARWRSRQGNIIQTSDIIAKERAALANAAPSSKRAKK